MYKKYKKDGFSLFINQKNNKKARSTSLRIVLNIYNGEGEIRTLARFNPSTPLAGAPIQPLEYFPQNNHNTSHYYHQNVIGKAGDENRTRDNSLEGYGFTTELHPQT